MRCASSGWGWAELRYSIWRVSAIATGERLLDDAVRQAPSPRRAAGRVDTRPSPVRPRSASCGIEDVGACRPTRAPARCRRCAAGTRTSTPPARCRSCRTRNRCAPSRDARRMSIAQRHRRADADRRAVDRGDDGLLAFVDRERDAAAGVANTVHDRRDRASRSCMSSSVGCRFSSRPNTLPTPTGPCRRRTPCPAPVTIRRGRRRRRWPR